MNPEHLSTCDYSFPKLSHKMALAVVRDLGFSAVDVGVLTGYGHTQAQAVVEDPQRTAHAVRDRVEAAHLVVADVFVEFTAEFETLAVNHPDATVRSESWRQFKQLVEFCRHLNAPGLSVLPGVTFEGIEPAASLELAADELQHRAEYAGELGIAFSVEPHYGSVVSTPASTRKLLERAPNVNLTLDYGHFIFQGIMQAEVDELIPRSRHIHIRPAAPGDMQTRAGQGTINFSEMLRRLTTANYRGYLSMEYCWVDWMDLNDVDCISETAVLRDMLLHDLNR